MKTALYHQIHHFWRMFVHRKQITAMLGVALSALSISASEQLDLLRQYAAILCETSPQDSVAAQIRLSLDSFSDSDAMQESTFLEIATRIGDRFREKGQLTKSIRLFSAASACYKSREKLLTDEETLSLIRFYIRLGAAHEELGMQSRAMNYYLEALSLSEKKQREDLAAVVYNNIGVLYLRKGNSEKAQEYFEKALTINEKLKNTQELFYNYNNLGGLYMARKEENRTLDYALQAIQLLDKEENADLYYFMQSNIGSLYLNKKDYSLAMSYLRNAMVHQEALGLLSDLVSTYAFLSELFCQTGKTDSSFIYMDKALAEIQNTGNRKMESELRYRQSDLFASTGNFKDAYATLQIAIALKDSIEMTDNSKKMADMERIFATERSINEKELTIQNLTLQKANSQRLWIILATLVLCLSISIIFLIYRYRSKEKERATQTLLSQQQKAIFEKEKEIQKQKEQELNRLVDLRNRELTSYTLYKMKTNEFISNITAELKRLLLELNPKDKEHKNHIQRIKSRLLQQNPTTDDEEFHYYFEQVHPSFYKNLEQAAPDLTAKEKRLCAFLRLGLSTKEIAAITFKETRSVESARNRLRKKLGIDTDESLSSFLSRF